MLGYDAPEDLLGRNIHQLAHHTRVDGSEYPFTDCRIIVACSAGNETYVNDEIFWRADGTSVPVEYWAQPVERDGAVVGAVVRFVERKSAGIAPAIG
jgi:PAS domain-containing protein